MKKSFLFFTESLGKYWRNGNECTAGGFGFFSFHHFSLDFSHTTLHQGSQTRISRAANMICAPLDGLKNEQICK